MLHNNCCEKILPSISSESVDLIVTDPPYGMSYKSNMQGFDNRTGTCIKTNKKSYFKEIANDKELPLNWLKDAYRILKNNSAIYIFCRWDKWSQLEAKVQECGFNIKNMIVINKSNHGMGDLEGSYAPKHELLMFAVKGRHKLNFEKRLSDVWNMRVLFSGAKRFHPNQKHESWVENCILLSSKEGDTVLDPFCGSGSFLVCAKKMKRKYIGIELDEEYYNISQQRLKNVVPSIYN